jgi:fructokinase
MRIGVDLGGTKIEAVALDDSGAVQLRRRVATPAGDYDGTLGAIRDLVTAFEAELQVSATVGIGTPGAISPRTGLMKNANSTILNGRPLDRDLARVLGREVRLENDANCFALSESVDGAGRGQRVVFGVILGTGVGGGVVVDGRPVSGRNRIAGEWGHNPLPWPAPDELPGPACYCGRQGCLETWLSGAGMVRTYRALTGRTAPAPEVFAAAVAGEAAALDAVDRYTDRLARGLASVVDILDPDAIVLGGGLSNAAPIYEDLSAKIARYAFSDGIDTPVLQAVHGDSSGVRGAAWLWPAQAGSGPSRPEATPSSY